MDPVALSVKLILPEMLRNSDSVCSELLNVNECLETSHGLLISYLILTERLKVISSIKDRIFQKFNMQNYYF